MRPGPQGQGAHPYQGSGHARHHAGLGVGGTSVETTEAGSWGGLPGVAQPLRVTTGVWRPRPPRLYPAWSFCGGGLPWTELCEGWHSPWRTVAGEERGVCWV